MEACVLHFLNYLWNLETQSHRSLEQNSLEGSWGGIDLCSPVEAPSYVQWHIDNSGYKRVCVCVC